MTEYSRLAKGRFTSTGGAQVVNLPFQPDYVEILNYTAAATPAANGIPAARWDANMGQGFAIVDLYNATPAAISGSIILNGISTFAAGQLLQFGAKQQVVSITKASPAVVTATAHGYTTGDVVLFSGLYQSATTGMPQIANVPFRITVIDANSFSILWNTNQSNYTALTGSPAGATVKKVLFPYLYEPGLNIISAITLGTTTTVVTTAAHCMVVGQEVAFRIPVVNGAPTAWGPTQLNSLPNGVTPGSPVYGYVVSVTDANTVVVNINSTGFTAFNSNVPFTSTVGGLTPPQLVAVGDVNTGGVQISAGSVLYPPPVVNGFNTINGPAIQGAFVNNTSQGFILGSGAAVGVAASTLVGAAGNVIYYRAYLHDLSNP